MDLYWHTDYALFALLVLGATAAALAWLTLAHGTRGLPLRTWILVALIIPAGWLAGTHNSQRERSRLVSMISGLAPTYARELSLMGHEHVGLDTPPDDPVYLEMIRAQIRWQRLNRKIADIYTMRLDDDGRVRLIIDSETDYTGDGKYTKPREHRTPIGEVYPHVEPELLRALAGEPVFAPEPVTDRWGTWVSAFEPMRGEDGRVEAVLGVDFGAQEWIAAIASARRAALLLVGLLLIPSLVSAVSWRRLSTELDRTRRAHERLAAGEGRLREVTSAVPGVVYQYLVDKDGNASFPFVSDGIVDLCGITPPEAVQDPAALFRPVLAEDLELIAESTRKSREQLCPWECQFRIRKPDGQLRWIRGHALPDRRADGSILYNGVLTDGTAQKSAEQALRRHARELAEAKAALEHRTIELARRGQELERARLAADAASMAKSTFLANMSHEIRTPITALLGCSEMLSDEGLDASERAQYVGTMRRNGKLLLALISDILDLSKIEAGRVQVERVPCSPARAMLEVAELIAHRAEHKGLDLRCELGGPVPEKINTDPTRLRQILLNLAGNAVKFTQRGSITIRLDMPSADKVRFTVTDTGIGMDADAIARVFRPFYQADASTTRRFGGTGLGLPIANRLAGLLGGGLDVSSEPGKGSVFTVMIDTGNVSGVAMVDDLDKVQHTRPARRDEGPLPTLAGRILLAEDGPDNQRLIVAFLRRAGAEVDVADNGAGAVRAVDEARAQGRPHDLILMDMHMPEVDGFEATRRIRASGYAGPIIALTAMSMSEDRHKCLQAGCDAYASKPIDRRSLLTLCDLWLRGRQRTAA